MKKVLSLLLAVTLILAVGCQQDTTNSSDNAPSSENTPSSESTPSSSNPESTPSSTWQDEETSIPSSVVISNYELKNIDGEYYLVAGEDPKYKRVSGSQIIGIDFKTLDELVNTVKGCNFTDGQLSDIGYFGRSSEYGEKKIKIFNLDKMYEPVFPKEYSLYRVSWGGERYSYSTINSENYGIDFLFYPKKIYEKQRDDSLDCYGHGISAQEVKTFPEYTQIYSSTDVAEIKNKIYKLETTLESHEEPLVKTDIYVNEQYLLASKNRPDEASSEVPQRLHLYWENDYFQFIMQIYHEVPLDPNWFLQFGAKPVK